MLTRVLTFSFILTSLFVIKDVCKCSRISDMCGESCSHVYDPVCGEATALDGRSVLKTFHNICHFNKISCWLMNMGNYNIEQVADIECGIESEKIISRRIHDFSIVGAHQACNHSCPTFCLDTYDPACAQIWAPNMQTYEYRPMINHCHIDLFSCVMGLNVTIQPLIGKCYKNPSALNFMFNVASLKSLKLLSYSDTRRSNSGSRIEIEEFTDLLQMLL